VESALSAQYSYFEIIAAESHDLNITANHLFGLWFEFMAVESDKRILAQFKPLETHGLYMTPGTRGKSNRLVSALTVFKREL